ncbi:lysophospholipid acyltransferase family protein [Myxococcota bacterium]|nr:lysophospholipid acyltransferase family protein [Myxococcota bacterium]
MNDDPNQEILEAPLPKRWGFAQHLKNTVLYVLVRVLYGFVYLLPHKPVAYLLSKLGELGYHLAASDRIKVLAHLKIAFPNKSDEERDAIARKMFAHLGRSAAELIHTAKLIENPDFIVFDEESERIAQEALDEGKGIVAITAHIGNWEMLAQALAIRGFPVTAIAKALYDPRLTRWVHEERTLFGMQMLWRGKKSLTQPMKDVLAHGEALALLIDQDTKVRGDFVPFFGKLAYTPIRPAELAVESGAAILVGWAQREGDKHIITIRRFHYERSGNTKIDVWKITAGLTAIIEEAIRHAPEQWVWMHRRWKTRPESEIE